MYFPLEVILTRLSVSGVVNDALQKEVDERIAVLLYEVDSTFTDSIIYKNKPKYIAVTDSVSGFKLENIKEGTYFLAALKEENSNYTFQSKTDKIGYRKRLLQSLPIRPMCCECLKKRLITNLNGLDKFHKTNFLLGMKAMVKRCR